MSRLSRAVGCSAVLLASMIVFAGVPAAAPAKADLWLGVLHHDFTLEPAFALVAGKWWADDDGLAEHSNRSAIADAIGKSPAQWLPPGRPLPTIWQAHMVDGRERAMRLSGVLHEWDYDALVVDTDLPRPGPGDHTGSFTDIAGIALVGSARMTVFARAPSERKQELVRLLAPAIAKAERTTIAKEAAGSDPSAPTFAKITSRMMATTQMGVESVLSSARPDGAIIYYLEGGKRYEGADYVGLRVSAFVKRSNTGALSIEKLWVEGTGDLWIEHQPLAIIERGGEKCWFTLREFEDGFEYILTKSPWASQEDPTLDCALR